MNAKPRIIEGNDMQAILAIFKGEYESLEDINEAIKALLYLTRMVNMKVLSDKRVREYNAKKSNKPKVLDRQQFNKINAALGDATKRINTLDGYLDTCVYLFKRYHSPRTEPSKGAE